MSPVPRILWASMLFSQLLITGIAWMIPTQPGDTMIASSMPLFALLAGAGSMSVPMWAKTNAQTTLILRCAIGEAATLFGLVAYMLSGSHNPQLLCAAVGIVSVLLAMPRG